MESFIPDIIMKEYLEYMIKAVENKDLIEFNRLNELFNKYDLFRQSCLCCFQFPELYQESLDDARKKLKELVI